MSKRTKHNQTCHDISVLRRAAGLEANRWKVKADIPGFPRPQALNGARPDIIAKKGKKTRIIEVETPETRFKDKAQHRRLRKYARRHKNTVVNVRTCDV